MSGNVGACELIFTNDGWTIQDSATKSCPVAADYEAYQLPDDVQGRLAITINGQDALSALPITFDILGRPTMSNCVDGCDIVLTGENNQSSIVRIHKEGFVTEENP